MRNKGGQKLRILVACEYSGTVSAAFRKLGHDAWSCDILPTDGDPKFHYQCDIFEVLEKGWDMMIAHPPCTYLTNSGVCWLHKDSERWSMLDDGAKFFKALMDSNIPKIVIENPIPHKYALERIGKKYTQIVQPWMFGHMERKATCLWLKGLEPLKPTNIVKEEMLKLPKSQQQRLHYLSPGPERAKLRSKTFQGIADAMAAQWG
jgi:hypothetical protein